MSSENNGPMPSVGPPPQTPTQTRTQRRVVRTRTSIEDAFIAAVSERGYGNVSVEDIAGAGDIAKATFYAHFDNKQALLEAVFARLTRELATRVAPPTRPRLRVRREATLAVFEHAAQLRDLYRVCLKNERTRSQYQAFVADVVEEAFVARVQEFDVTPRVPGRAAALAFAGAHAALLEGWLDGELTGTPEHMAATEIALLIPGLVQAVGLEMSDMDGI